MKTLLFSILIASLASQTYAANLPADAALKLKKWNSGFKVFSEKDYGNVIKDLFEKDQQPMIFSADLNNDKIDDFVVIGHDQKKQYVVALMRQKNDWSPIEVTSWDAKNHGKIKITNPNTNKQELTVPVYIMMARGPLAEEMKPKKAIQIERYEVQPDVFEIKDNKAIKLTN